MARGAVCSVLRALGRRNASSRALLSLARADLWPHDSPDREPTFRQFAWDVEPGEAWACVGQHAGALVDAALIGRARCEPHDARRWPFLDGRMTSPEAAIKRVRFLAPSRSGGFSECVGWDRGRADEDSWTARYGALRDEDTATLHDHLAARADSPEHLADTCESLDLGGLLQNPFVTLSNGQTRRARIASALLQRPEVLVLEEPLAGLDVRSRASVDAHLRRLHATAAPCVVVSVRTADGVPDWATHIVDVRPDRSIAYLGPRDGWRPATGDSTRSAAPAVEAGTGAEIVRLDGISVTGRRPVLIDVDWTIREGERWALKGSNGSGKSTTLGLITGDHPQSYSSALTLFGRPRSSYATSDLHSRIGHVSPEINSAFPRSTGMSARDVIATGFAGVYTYRRVTPEQSAQLHRLIEEFDYPDVLTPTMLHTPFGHLSPAHQALALFLRAVVKRPALLILDEAFQAQSDVAIERCRTYIDQRLDPQQAVIVVSHYEDEIPATVNRVLRLEAGRVVERR